MSSKLSQMSFVSYFYGHSRLTNTPLKRVEQNVTAHYTMMACHLTTNYRLSNSNRICLVCERYRVTSCSSLSMVLPAVVVPDHSKSKLQFVNRRIISIKWTWLSQSCCTKQKTRALPQPLQTVLGRTQMLHGFLRYLPTQLNTLRLLRAINLSIVQLSYFVDQGRQIVSITYQDHDGTVVAAANDDLDDNA